MLTAVYDPELPIRGRYLSERLNIPTEGFTYTKATDRNTNEWFLNRQWAYLEVRNGQLIAKAQGSESGMWVNLRKNADGTIAALSEESVLVFISERAVMSNLKAGEEMWG